MTNILISPVNNFGMINKVLLLEPQDFIPQQQQIA
jgi:hypothetical protein